MYPRFAPSTLLNMAAPKVLVIWLKINCYVYVYVHYVFVEKYGMESNQFSTLPRRLPESIRYMH